MPPKKTTAKSTTKTTTRATTKKAPVVKKTTAVASADQKVLVKKLGDQVEKKSSMFQTVVVILLVILTAMSFLNYKENIAKNNLEESLRKVEAMKVGGEENFKLLKKILNHPTQQSQYKEQFETLLNQLGDVEVDAEPTEATAPAKEEAAAPVPTANTLSADNIAAVTAGYVYGNPNSDIVVIEYSDVECPFCKRHHVQGTLKQVVDNFGGKVSYVYKHFPLGFHANAQKGGEALECLGEQLGNDQFFAYIEKVYAGEGSDVASLTAIATEMGANTAVFQACLNEGKFAQKVKDQMAEGSSLFQVTGTPGNVVLNKKTGEWKLISGAYPYAEFEKTVNELLN